MTDIELGVVASVPNPPVSRSSHWHSFVLSWHLLKLNPRRHTKKRNEEKVAQPQIEDYRKGYPRFAALMAAHGAFHIFRRFSHVRTRLILLAQDKVVRLEEQLARIDQAETSPLFLASSREDRNAERELIVLQLHARLEEYDRLLESSQRAFAYETPHTQYVSSLQRWIRGNSCIARNEAKFLDSEEDLLTLSPMDDGAVGWLERIVCDAIVRRFKGTSRQKSRDPNVHIFTQSSTIKVARALLSPLIAVLLLAPVIICSSINSLTARLVIMVAATGMFICCVSLLTKAKTIELAVAGATYTTVLVVFISGPNTGPN